MKIRTRILAIGIACAVFLTACSVQLSLDKSKEYTSVDFDEFCEELIQDTFAEDSLNAHFTIENLSQYGITYDEDDYNLGELSFDYMNDTYKDMEDSLDKLCQFDLSDFSEEQLMTYNVLKDYIEKQYAYKGTVDIQNIMSPSSGLMSNLSTNFVEYQFYNEEDIEHYFSYLKDVKRYMEDVCDYVREQSQKGYFMSDAVADEVIEFCENYLKSDNDPMIASFNDKISKMPLSDTEVNEYTKKNQEYVKKYFNPVYQIAIDLLKSLKGTGTNAGGLCNYGSLGKKYYNAILQDKTSTSMSANEIIDLLDDSMSDIIKRITAIAIADYGAYDEFAEYSPDYSDPNEMVEYIRERMKDDFPEPATNNYSIEYQNKACEIDGVIAYYMSARIDDISVNNIKVNGSAVADDKLMLYTTLAHEGYPGHLYEFTNFYNNQDIPAVRKVISFIGATEGYAEYAADYSLEYLDISDNVRNLIKLNDMFSYVMCSRVDLGVNYEGWDVDDVSDYLESISLSKELAETVYLTAVGDPGIYLPYTIGHIKMDEMYDKASKTLGSDFSNKEYNNWLVNKIGIVSFDIYETELDKWLNNTGRDL